MAVWVPKDDGHADLASHDSFLQGPPHLSGKRSAREYADPDQGRQTFSKSVMAGFEPVIRALCAPIFDEALEKGSFDATKDIARQLPMRMLGRIRGTPEEDLPWMVEKGDALIANTDPDFTSHVPDKMTTDKFRKMPFDSSTGAELFVYGKELVRRKAEAGDTFGILHLLLQQGCDGSTLPKHEFRNFFCLLVAAGNDTTRYSIAAGIQALCHQPELLSQLLRGEVCDTMADEVIRCARPTSYFRRTATRDFDFHGKIVKAGEKVLYWFSGGDRDESTFAAPFRVDFARTTNRQVAFWQGGPHVCLGMWLARLEVRVPFEELAKRITSVEPAGEHRFLRSNFIGGSRNCPSEFHFNRRRQTAKQGGSDVRAPARHVPRSSFDHAEEIPARRQDEG